MMICPNCGSVQAYDTSSCTICGYELEISKTGAKLSSISTESGQKILVRSFSAVFNSKKFGINFSIGVGYFISSILTIFTWRIVNQIMWQHPQSNLPFEYYFIVISFNLLEALLFVFLVHQLNKEWTIPLFFGLGLIVLGIFERLVLGALRIENMNFWSPFNLQGIIFNFVWGFLFMGGLILFVKLRGPHLWSLVLGMMLSLCVSQFIFQLYYLIKYHYFSYWELFPAAINGIIFGGAIFAGLAFHLNQKGYRLANGNLYSKRLA